jgi:ribosome-associated toxin RatA of RatAB toxin-antitoxin module
MVVEASPARCFEVVADIERYPEWVADLKEVHILESDDEGRPVVVSFRAAGAAI